MKRSAPSRIITRSYATLISAINLSSVSAEETLASWKLYTPILNAHRSLHNYPAALAPKEAEELMKG